MAEFLTREEVQSFGAHRVNLETLAHYVIPTGNCVGAWVAPSGLKDLSVGQHIGVSAMGALRAGVVVSIGRTKVTVAFTTAGAIRDFLAGNRSGIRVQTTAYAPEATRVRPDDLELAKAAQKEEKYAVASQMLREAAEAEGVALDTNPQEVLEAEDAAAFIAEKVAEADAIWTAAYPDAHLEHGDRPNSHTPEAGWMSQCRAAECPGHWRTGMETKAEARVAYAVHHLAAHAEGTSRQVNQEAIARQVAAYVDQAELGQLMEVHVDRHSFGTAMAELAEAAAKYRGVAQVPTPEESDALAQEKDEERFALEVLHNGQVAITDAWRGSWAGVLTGADALAVASRAVHRMNRNMIGLGGGRRPGRHDFKGQTIETVRVCSAQVGVLGGGTTPCLLPPEDPTHRPAYTGRVRPGDVVTIHRGQSGRWEVERVELDAFASGERLDYARVAPIDHPELDHQWVNVDMLHVVETSAGDTGAIVFAQRRLDQEVRVIGRAG